MKAHHWPLMALESATVNFVIVGQVAAELLEDADEDGDEEGRRAPTRTISAKVMMTPG